MKKAIVILSVFLMLLGCASTKTDTSISSTKMLDDLVTQKSFKIESDWAQPQVTNSLSSVLNAGLLPPGSSASMISLTGNSNYVKIKGDSITGYLPYFGERQMGGSYGNTGTAIQFDDIPDNYEVTKGKKNSYLISFKIRDKTNQPEGYSVNIELFSNLTSTINVNSSHRFSIRYRGNVSKIDDE